MSLLNVAVLLIGLFSISTTGCKETGEEFSGLVGRVGVSPIANVTISVYDGVAFLGLDSDSGLIDTDVSNERGAFTIAIPDSYIGHTLIVVAEFPEDDGLTVEDDRAFYVDYSDVGENVRLDPEDGPWIAMVNLFEGLSVPVSITPWTTVAFHSLANLPDDEVGVGNLRYIKNFADQTQRSVAVNLGLAADPARVFPAVPDLGGDHPAESTNSLERTRDSAALTYTLMQLDRAAAEYVEATDNAGDDQTDFFNALFDDAKDGLLDGMLFGEDVAYFVSDGAPDVSGQEAGGVSKILAYITDNGVVDADELELLEDVGGGFTPDEGDLLERQSLATGAVRTIRVDSTEIAIVPESGGVEVTVIGEGLLSDVKAILATNTDSTTSPLGTNYTVDADSTGDDGEIMEARHDRVVILYPDLDSPNVPAAFRVNEDTEEHHLFLRFDLDGPDRNALTATRFAGAMTVFTESGLHILDARIVCLGEGVEVTGAMNVEAAVLDPATLDPAADDVYALELSVLNASGDDIDDITLDLDALSIFIGSDELVFDTFGGTEDGPVVVFPSAAQLAADAIAVASGDVGALTVRFILDGAQVGDAFETGDLVEIVPAVVGDAGGDEVSSADVAFPDVSAEFTILDRDNAPVITTDAVANDAEVEAGDTITLTWTLDVAGRVTATHRSCELNALVIAITPDGGEEQTIRVTRTLTTFPVSINGILLTGITVTEDGFDASGLPLEIVGDTITVSVTLRMGNIEGDVDVTLDAEWGEALSGFSGTASDTAVFTVTEADTPP